MPDDLSPLKVREFAQEITQLEKLLSQSKRAFLMGAGCSHCAGLPLMPGLTGKIVEAIPKDTPTGEILHGIKGNFDGAKSATIEDFLSELVDVVSLAERRKAKTAARSDIRIGTSDYTVDQLTQAMTQVKKTIAECISKSPTTISVHRQFVRTMHGTLQSGKNADGRTVDYFLLNYDTLVEDALALERRSTADGFSGGATGWWDGRLFDRTVDARIFKVHGSIDWCLLDHDVFPRRIRPGINPDSSTDHVVIWPASTKYRETQRDPYAQIMHHMRRVLRPAEGAEIVLAICGYAFGDSHINIEIDEALHESQQRLTILAFTNEDAPTGQLHQWLSDPAVCDQVRVYANRGFFHGKKAITAKADLLWWKFENLVRILGGER